MKVLYSWLCEYLNNPPDFDSLISNITKIGFSVDDVKKIGVDAEGVVTAKVLKKEKHPNADKLSLCEVSDGSNAYTVVCGAKNVEAGQVVPLALAGAKLGGGVLKKAKIRGVESNGMICSAQELGLEENSEGIMVLDPKTPLGLDIKKIYNPDYVFELEITPNLAYCLSHYSLARELSIFCGYDLKEIKIPDFTAGKDNFEIKIETDNCLRYCGIIIRNIKNTQTPDFISQRLKKIGVNPKNNILIDVSNYVMFEFGQPTHCFDLNNVERGIIVRNARAGEKIKALDSNEYELKEDVTVIADLKKPLAVAGVIGGYYSSINEKTSDILIEIANFKPSAVRKSSKYLNIKTDSSYRFERGVDFNLVEIVSKRMVEIIKSSNPDCLISFYGDVKRADKETKIIDIDADKINSILGTKISREEMTKVFKKIDESFDGIKFKVPSYRSDIESIWDLAEEVARYLGYEIIESKTDMKVMKSNTDPYLVLKNRFLQKISVFGFNEALNYDLVSEKDITNLGFDIKNSIKLANPLSKEFEFLRPSLLVSLLKNLRYNLNRGIKSLKICEFGTVFENRAGKPYENRRFAGIISGIKDEWEYWKEKEESMDYFYLKTVVNHLLSDFESLKINGKSEEKYMVEDVSSEVFLNGKKTGFFGMLNPEINKLFDVKADKIFYFDFDFDTLCSSYKTDFASMAKKPKSVSQFQYGIRDLSFIVDKKYAYRDIYESISKTKDLLDLRLIDVYEGERIEKGKKSFTFRFIFSSMEKTFTDEELNKKIEEVIKVLSDSFGAKLR